MKGQRWFALANPGTRRWEAIRIKHRQDKVRIELYLAWAQTPPCCRRIANAPTWFRQSALARPFEALPTLFSHPGYHWSWLLVPPPQNLPELH